MSATIELPVWLVALAGALAAVAFVDRQLTPAMGWFFRRRVNRAIEELNTRLQLKIKPFGLTRRQVLIDRVAHDPDVMIAAEEHAREQNMPVACRRRHRSCRAGLDAAKDRDHACLPVQEFAPAPGREMAPFRLCLRLFRQAGFAERDAGEARVGALIDRLAERGAHVHVAHADRDYEVTAGLRMLTLRRIVTRGEGGLLRIAPGEEPLVAYYANAIRHLL